MPAELIEDFRKGLDTRKFMLNSPAGTLTTLQNAHITPGGEIEKRKAFTRTALPTNSYGLEVTSAGFVVFGSVAAGSLNAALPSGVTYQRLQHPDGSTAMSAVLHSTVFEGAAFVVATFGAGGTFAFYDGKLIYDFVSGQATAWLNSNEGLANHLAALINQSAAFSSSSASLVSGSDYKIVVTSPSGLSTEVTIEKDSTAGTLTNQLTRTQVDGIIGVTAQGQFQIRAGSASAGTNTISSVQVGGQELLAAAVDYTTGNDATAAAVKDAINAREGSAAPIASYARTGTTVVLTMSNTPKHLVGDSVTVAGVTPGVGTSVGIHGTWTLTAVDSGAKTLTFTSTTSGTASGTGGTVTMATRIYTAAVDEAVVQLVASATGTAANDKLVSVTGAGDVCVDQYSFKITLQSGSGAVPTVQVFIDGTDQTGGAVEAAASLEAMATAVALAVRTTGSYNAAAAGNEVFLSRKTTTSASAALNVMVILGANTGGVVTGAADILVVTPGPADITFFGPASQYLQIFTGGTALTVNVAGGVAPYSYLWEIGSSVGTQFFNAGSATNGHPRVQFLPDSGNRSPQLKFTRTSSDSSGNGQNNFSGNVKVTVTDGAGRSATAELWITAKYYPYT